MFESEHERGSSAPHATVRVLGSEGWCFGRLANHPRARIDYAEDVKQISRDTGF
jgi:hypothetical protein